MHDGMPYGRNQGQGQGHSREVDRQSPTGLIFIAMCAVFWLFWLSYQYLPSDWLERLVCAPHSFVFPWAVESSPLHFLALA